MNLRPLATFAALTVVSSAVLADENANFADALTKGELGLALRARYEGVDQDGIAEDANALTTRLRLNYETSQWRRASAVVEFDYVFHLLGDFNSGGGTSPAKSQYPVIADPKGSDLNQLYIDFAASDSTDVRLGRQRILLDNQRFVGGVGWRQNEQTYDGVTINTQALPNTALSYSYVGQVRRIFGDKVDAGSNNVDVHLLHAAVTINKDWKVSPYYYRIDNDDVAAFSTATLGARLSGGLEAGGGKLALVGELATQSDIANNPVSYDADYVHLSATWSASNSLSLGIGFESLGSDVTAMQSFRTPLATLHAFQGWADKFLSTPALGIDDVFATVKYTAGRWKLTGVYHDFSSESGSVDYGTEIDISAGTKVSENYGLLLKAAIFSGDATTFPNTQKIWLMFTANY